VTEFVTVVAAVSLLVSTGAILLVVRWALGTVSALVADMNDDRNAFYEHASRQWQTALNAGKSRTPDEYNRMQRSDQRARSAGAAVPATPKVLEDDIDHELRAMGLVDDRAPVLRSVPDSDAPILPEGLA
jgi:hypothetical protein